MSFVCTKIDLVAITSLTKTSFFQFNSNDVVMLEMMLKKKNNQYNVLLINHIIDWQNVKL